MTKTAELLGNNPILVITVIAALLIILLIIGIVWGITSARGRKKLHQTQEKLWQKELDLKQKAYDDKSWQGDINALEQQKSQTETEISRIERETEILSRERSKLQDDLSAAQKASGLPSIEGDDYADWLRKREAAEKLQRATEQFRRDNQPVWLKAEALLGKLRKLNAAMPFMERLSDDFPAWVDSAKQKIAADDKEEQKLQAAEKERDNLSESLLQKQKRLKDLISQAEQKKADWQDKISALFGGRINVEMAKNIPALQCLSEAERQAAQLLAEQRKNADLLSQTLKQMPETEAASLNSGAIAAILQQTEEERKLNDETFRNSVQEHTQAQAAWDNIGRNDETAQLAQRKMTLGLELQNLLQNYAEQSLGLKLAHKALMAYRERHRSGMMLATERAFAALTNGAYPKLQTSLNGDDEVLQAVPRDGGGLKRADAMSKGTRFQLYMALRAAAYEQLLAKEINLPFFCDDVFETFDDERTSAACRLMQHIGRQGQAIYFTHHRHVADIAKEICGDNVQIHEI